MPLPEKKEYSNDDNGSNLSSKILHSSAIILSAIVFFMAWTLDFNFFNVYAGRQIAGEGNVGYIAKFVDITVWPPVSYAGVPHAGTCLNPLTPGLPHTHDGASASDPDGDLSGYSWDWFQNQCPGGTCPPLTGSVSGTLSGFSASVPGPTFTPTAIGDHTLILTITDVVGFTSTSTVTEGTANSPPVADAGVPHANLLVGSNHCHPNSGDCANGNNGAWASDPNGNLKDYSWSFVSCPTAPWSPTCPVIAGPSGNPTPQDVIATGGDRCFAFIPGALGSISYVPPVFTAPVFGTYTLRLTVTDTAGSSASSNIVETTSNRDATVSAGAPHTAANPPPLYVNQSPGHTHTGATASDPDGNLASYTWNWEFCPGFFPTDCPTMTAGASGSIPMTAPNAVYNIPGPTFAPNRLGNLQLRLDVYDYRIDGTLRLAGQNWVTEVPVNRNPVINSMGTAHTNAVIFFPHSHTGLDRAQVSDPDGNLSFYQWTCVSGPSGCVPVSGSGSISGFGPVYIDGPAYTPNAIGDYILRLTVTDTLNLQTSQTFTETAVPPTITINSFTANPSGILAIPASTTLRVVTSYDGLPSDRISYDLWWNCNIPDTSISSTAAICGNLATPVNGQCVENGNGAVCREWTSQTLNISHTYYTPGITIYPKIIVNRDSALPKEARTSFQTIPRCQDGIDNDGDGLVDTFDPGCHTDGNPSNPASYNPNDNDESNHFICSAGACAYAPGPGFNTGGCTYSRTYPTPQACVLSVCNDGIDNDGDGQIDFPDDPGCVATNDADESDPPFDIKEIKPVP